MGLKFSSIEFDPKDLTYMGPVMVAHNYPIHRRTIYNTQKRSTTNHISSEIIIKE